MLLTVPLPAKSLPSVGFRASSHSCALFRRYRGRRWPPDAVPAVVAEFAGREFGRNGVGRDRRRRRTWSYSPYSKPAGVSEVPCDHTSVLATIEHKWNLPALTNRDANAATVMDFLDPGTAGLLNPPPMPAPSTTGPSRPVSPRA